MSTDYSGIFTDLTSSQLNGLYGDGDEFFKKDVPACREAFNDAVLDGPKRLKQFMRRFNLPPAHPFRQTLWPLLISTKFGVSIPQSEKFDENYVSPAHNGKHGVRAGFELSDDVLLSTFHLNEEGKSWVLKILHSIAIAHPEIVYAPQLWPLVAIFLHYHCPQVSRACVLALIERSDYLVRTKADWKEQCFALEFLGRAGFVPRAALLPWKLWKRSGAQDPRSSNPRERLIKWPITIWQLPFNFVVRLVDCFLLEGPKVLYRAGLVIWTTSVKMNSANSGSCFDISADVAQTLLNPDAMLKRMFSILGFSRNDIRRAILTVRKLKEQLMDDSLAEQLLIHPCINDSSTTYVSYLCDSAPFVHPSECINASELASLIVCIRDKRLAQLSKPVLLFSSSRDGTSLRTLYQRAAESASSASVLLVRSSSGRSIIGAFCSERWHVSPQPSFYGTGLCFLFRIRPGSLTVYHWLGFEDGRLSSAPQNFQYSTTELIQIGGSEASGFPGLRLDNNLSLCTTGPSTTFGNPCLISDEADKTQLLGEQNEACVFSVGLVELIGFADL